MILLIYLQKCQFLAGFGDFCDAFCDLCTETHTDFNPPKLFVITYPKNNNRVMLSRTHKEVVISSDSESDSNEQVIFPYLIIYIFSILMVCFI